MQRKTAIRLAFERARASAEFSPLVQMVNVSLSSRIGYVHQRRWVRT